MKNIWIPHIPKNGGTSIYVNLLKYCVQYPDKFDITILQPNYDNPFNATSSIFSSLPFIRKKLTRDEYIQYGILDRNLWTGSGHHPMKHYIEIKNNQTNVTIKIHHLNPLEVGMEDWLKILILREPINRFISKFNHIKLRSFTKFKLIDTRTIDEWIEDHKNKIKLRGKNFETWDIYRSQLSYLNIIQNRMPGTLKDPLVKEFNIENTKTIFDHIMDISNMNKVYLIIEEHFLQEKIDWGVFNTAEENILKLNSAQKEHIFKETDTVKKENLTTEQLTKIKIIPEVKKDIEFYSAYEKYMDPACT